MVCENTQKGIILVVEDDKVSRTFLHRTLEKNGFSCLLAEDGRAALEIFIEFRNEIKFIISDFSMPEMNGLEFARQACQIDSDFWKKIIFLTANRNDLIRCIQENNLSLGPEKIHSKPIIGDDLLEAIRSAA